MPMYGNQVVVEIACGIKAFLSLRVGITRGEAPDIGSRQLQKRLERKNERIERLERSLEARDRRIARLERKAGSVNPENLVWIFGTARTGSTWLGSMLEELEGWDHWREPYVGALFGNLY